MVLGKGDCTIAFALVVLWKVESTGVRCLGEGSVLLGVISVISLIASAAAFVALATLLVPLVSGNPSASPRSVSRVF